jgi:acyl-CoA thioesterase-1
MESKWRAAVALIILLAGCGDRPAPPGQDAEVPAPGTGDARPVVLFVGTSLTAGYGLNPGFAFPAVIQRKIDSSGLGFRAVNAGVSGETSAGALRRIDWLLERERPAVLVLETGANDGLRGHATDTLRANILAIFERAGRVVSPPLLVLLAMEALPNLGETYVAEFREIFPAAARASRATLVPFFLAGVAGVDTLNQPDGIHPTPRGQEIAANNVWKMLEPVLRKVAPPRR